MTIDLTAGIVRILDSNNQTVGAGFVLTADNLIATCAHVVQSAGAGPGDTVCLVFHLASDEATATVELEGWRAPEAEDIAILRLNTPLPSGVMPLPLGRSDGTVNHPFETFGFPDANPHEGLWGTGHILRQTTLGGVGVLQLQSQEVTPGFSGAPIWDITTQCIVGMVTAITTPDEYGRLTQTAFAIPTDVLHEVWPTLPITSLSSRHTTFLSPSHPDNLRTTMSPGIRPGEVPPFHELDEYTFQELCRDLFDAEPGIATCEIYGTRGQPQDGIDLLAHCQNGDGIEVGQCKCYTHFSPRQIREASDEFFVHWEKHWSKENVKRFILLVACDLSRRKQQDEIVKQKKRFGKFGISYEVWSAAKIRNKLRLHRGIVANYLTPPEHWVQVICGISLTPSPPISTQMQSSPVVSAVLTNQIEQLAIQLSGETERRLEMMRIAWREGRKDEAIKWLTEIVNDQTRWPALTAEVKAKLLCFQGSLELDTTDDIERARQLADQARAIAPTSNEFRLRAFIAYIENHPTTALELLAEQTDLDSLNLKAAILLEIGRVEECQTTLTLENLSIEPNAETFRLLALSYLAARNLHQANLAIQKALALGQRWQNVRFAAAVINYFNALSPVAWPNHLVSWPEPVDWTLVKRDDESVSRLREAAEVFRELAESTDGTNEERQRFEAWRLACLANDSERQEEARTFCELILQANPANYRAIAWAIARQFDIDLMPSQTALAHLVTKEVANIFHVLALTSCYLAFRNAPKALQLLDNTRLIFQKHKAEILWHSWYIQSLVAMSDYQAALTIIEQAGRPVELRHVQTLVLSAIAKLSNDWQRVLQHLESSYEETGDPNFLFDSCELMAWRKQWVYVADRVEQLVAELGTSEAVRLAVIATYQAKRLDYCLELLDHYQYYFKHGKLPAELRRIRVFCLADKGSLQEAITEADALAREEPIAENLLPLAQLYFTKGDLKGLAIVARQLDYLPHLSAESSLHIARLVPSEDRGLAISLWRKASQDLPDMFVGEAVAQGFKLGLDQELEPLMTRIAYLGQERQGGIQVGTINDLIALAQKWREREAELNDFYLKGSVPIHLILEEVNHPLVEPYHNLLSQNEIAPNPIKQRFLLIRHGGKVLMSGFPESIPKWSLNLDPTAIILAEHLGILVEVEKAFAPLRIPIYLIPALLRMREKLTHHQPSRLQAYEQVFHLVEHGMLQVKTCNLSPAYENRKLVEEMGEEWTALFEYVRTNHGYLVDFFPLKSRPDFSRPPSALPGDTDQYLINCRAVIESLHQQGPLSATGYTQALKALGEEGRQEATRVIPQKGTLLFFDRTIAEFLAGVNLLSVVCETFQSCIEQREVDQIKATLNYQKQQHTIIEWLDNLISRLRQGLDNGIYKIISVQPVDKEELEKEAVKSPDVACLLALLKFKPQEGDVIWADERWLNGYHHRDSVPIIGINEVLKALVRAEAITVNDYYAKLNQLRAANVRFIPLQSDEILYHLEQARVDKNIVIETRELAILRRYIAACLEQSYLFQHPPLPDSGPNPAGELAFIISLEREISKALVELWRDTIDKTDIRSARAEWLLSNLYIDLLGLTQVTSWPRTEPDDRYLMAVSLMGLISQAIALKVGHNGEVNVARRDYFDWLYWRVLQAQFDKDSNLVRAVVDMLKTTLRGFRKEKYKNVPKRVVIWVVQKFFEDLPALIRGELARDPDFMADLDFRLTVPIDDLNFASDDFWSAATEAINGRLAAIVAIGSNKPVIFAPFDHPQGRPAFSFKHPVTQEEKIVKGDELALLGDSPPAREAALRQLRRWFDSYDDVFEQAIAKIMTIESPPSRIEAATWWRDSSAVVYYASLHRQLKQDAGFQFDDLLPPSADGLLRFLRLLTEAKPGTAFPEALTLTAQTLLRQEGLYEAIRRLVGFPVPLPEVLVEAVADLSSFDRRLLIKELLATAASPLSQVHLLYLLRRFGHEARSYQRLTRRIIQQLLSAESAEVWEAFSGLLNWVSNEFSCRADMYGWPPHLRLAMIWSHTHQLFTLFMATNVPLAFLRDTFNRSPRRVSPEIFERQANNWFDLAHPRQVNRAAFLVGALTYGLGEEVIKFAEMGLKEAFMPVAFMTIEGVQLPVLSLLRDPAQASNILASFLGEDRNGLLRTLLGEEQAHIFTSPALQALIEQTIDILAEAEDRILAWSWLEALLGVLPPPGESATRLKTVIHQADFVALVKTNVDLGCLALMVASQQAIHFSDETLRQRLKDEMIQVTKLLAGLEFGTSIRAIDDEDFDEAQFIFLRLFESALNLSLAVQTTTEVIPEFRDIITQLAAAWPKMISAPLRPIIQRLCEELPIHQAKQLWPLLVYLRAQ